ncbi:MAG: V-type ATP synthase subunit K [Clostridia bacterium]|nr:V-type ATP synthase subunit K [Clostridia bacterium]
MGVITEIIKSIITGNNIAILAAALAVVLPGFGSARAVNMVARATAGLICEEPNKYGKSMLLQALPMTQGIYGMVIAFLIMVFSGIMGGTADLSVSEGAYYLFAAMPIAFGGWYSALKQGEVAAAGVSVLAKRPEAVGKAVISASFVELYAILALLISILLVL